MDEDDTERGRRRLSAHDRQVLESARAVVEAQDTDDITSPVDLLLPERESPEAHTLADRLRRDRRDSYDMAANIALAMYRRRAEEKSGKSELASQLADSMTALKTDVHDLKRDSGNAKWIGRGLLAAALTLFLYVADRILVRVEREGETTIRMQRLEITVEEIRQDLRSLRHFDPFPTTKGQSP